MTELNRDLLNLELQEAKLEQEAQVVNDAVQELKASKIAVATARDVKKEQLATIDKIWAKEEKDKVITKYVLDTIQTGNQIFDSKIFDQYALTLKDFFYELEMCWRAITTRQIVKGLISNYYDPILYDYVKVYANKLKESIFEGNDYFGFKNKQGELNDYNLIRQRNQVKHHIQTSNVKAVWKEAFEHACKWGTAITKYLPAIDSTMYEVRYQDQTGTVITDWVNKRDKLIGAYNVRIFDLYLSNAYEPDLNKQNFVEMKETSFQELKRLESMGIYRNIDAIKAPTNGKEYGISDDVYDKLRRLMDWSKDKVDDLVKKNAKDFKVRIAEFWGCVMLDDGQRYKVRLTLAGMTLIGVHLQTQITGGDYVPYEVLRLESYPREFYGWGKMHRLIKTQLLHNLLWNLSADLNIKNLQGNMYTSQENKILIQQQIDNGLKPNEVIGINIPSGMRADQIILPIKYPDPNNVQQINESLLQSKFERGTLSRAQQGLPTGSQLDRSGKGYAMAVGQGDSNIKEDIYTIQDTFLPRSITQIFFIVARNAYEKVFVGYEQDVDSMGNRIEQPVFASGKDLYGIPNIEIYGGSLYLENEKKIQDIKDLVGMIANSKAAERINWDAILQRYATLRGFDANEFVNNKSAIEMLQDIFATGVAPEQLEKVLSQIVEDRNMQMIREKEGQMVSEQQYQVNKLRVDQAYEDAIKEKNKRDAEKFDDMSYLEEEGLSALEAEDQIDNEFAPPV